MAYVTFLWHLHQPSYRTADRVSHAPWAALHAGGAYTSLARAILSAGGRGQVVNIVPTLLEQLEAYRDRTVDDPVIDALSRPTAELGLEERRTLVEWAFHVAPRQLGRFPRLRELAARRSSARTDERLARLFGTGDLRDLQVLTVLAHAGEQAWRDPRLEPLFNKGHHFAAEDQRAAADWLAAQPGELLDLWQRLAKAEEVEVATSPFAHPIMPLLVDTGVVQESWAPHPAPVVPPFQRPEDARWQLETALAFMRQRGFDPRGCWPPEGSVSTAAVALYGAAGVRWLVTDEGILERSLGRSLRHGVDTQPELYRPWRVADEGPHLFFRDRSLSDEIGFVYGHWDDERRAATALVSNLEGLARSLPEEAAIVIALDGENPWLHYPEGGGAFLGELFERLNGAGPGLVPATLSEVVRSVAATPLPTLHPGSWINSIFATWIGHPEKTLAWSVLAAVREAIEAADPRSCPSLLLAEASDWFWWLGDDNPTPLAPLYDRIFRLHLRDVCEQGGIEPPVDLEKPLKTVTRPLQVPVSREWPAPVLDGRVTSYFEWSLAARVVAELDQPLRRMALWGGRDALHLLVEGEDAVLQLVEGSDLVVELHSPEGKELVVEVGPGGCDDPRVEAAVGRVAELTLPWDGRPGYRLQVRLGTCRLPEGGVLLLEPVEVDEELLPEWEG